METKLTPEFGVEKNRGQTGNAKREAEAIREWLIIGKGDVSQEHKDIVMLPKTIVVAREASFRSDSKREVAWE